MKNGNYPRFILVSSLLIVCLLSSYAVWQYFYVVENTKIQSTTVIHVPKIANVDVQSDVSVSNNIADLLRNQTFSQRIDRLQLIDGIQMGDDVTAVSIRLCLDGVNHKITTDYVKNPTIGINKVKLLKDGYTINLYKDELLTEDKVYWLQEQLKIAGYYCSIDGDFGIETERALKKYTSEQLGYTAIVFNSTIERALIINNKDRLAGDINDYKVIVNKDKNLLRSDVPSRLTEISVAHAGNVKLVESQTNIQLEKMFNAALAEGIRLRVISGYRDFDYQTMLFDSYSAKEGIENANIYSALPGQSEHQTGLAVDIADNSGSHILTQTFDATLAYNWLNAHAAEYGFILSFPKGWRKRTGYSYEPWHYRYVGSAELAIAIEQSGQTLEEYLASN